MQRFFISCLLALLVSGQFVSMACAQAEPGSAGLQAAVDEARKACRAPGCVVLLKQAGTTSIIASGLADVGSGRAIAADDCFAIGSITKMFTATLVLQLAAEDRLDLRLPRALIPLIAMQDYSPEEVVDYAGSLPVYFPPGQGNHYSNTNFFLLGLVLEQVSGQSYHELLDRRIIAPLGLKHTLLAGEDQLPDGMVHGYALINGELRDRSWWENPSLAWAAGGLVSNVADLELFITALFDGRLIPQDMLKQMQESAAPPAGGRYGLGLMLYELRGGRFCGHSGQTLGFTSDLYYQAASGRTMCVLANLASCPTTDIIEAVLALTLDSGQAAGAGASRPEQLQGSRESGAFISGR